MTITILTFFTENIFIRKAMFAYLQREFYKCEQYSQSANANGRAWHLDHAIAGTR